MKIIDLLNKIANGEEVPKKIKYDYKKFEFIGGAYEDEKGNDLCYYDDSCMAFLNDEVEIIEENKKELHANNIEFNIYDDKKEFIITLDENDLGIDKLHLDNCYFYKENDKWYVKHINLKPIAYISQEHKIPEKLEICYSPDIEEEIFYEKGNKPNHYVLGDAGTKFIINKINEILDYLEVNKDE